MSAVLWIALGGALGSVGRYLISMHVDRLIASAFPWGTMVCNVVGCVVIGFLAEILVEDERMWLSPEARQGVMVGVLGGFTTFSSFGLQTFAMVKTENAWGWASTNVGLSLVLCLFGVWLGAFLGSLVRSGA